MAADTTPTTPALPTYSVFATRLRQLRMQANLKQEDMARLLSIHRTAYTKYETDRAAPDQAGLLVLANYFQVSVDYLLGHEQPQTDDNQTNLLRDNSEYLMLDVREQTLIAAFRQLPEQRRSQIVQACCEEVEKHKETTR